MTITITDTAWGVNRMTGSRNEKVVDNQTYPLVLGKLNPIGPAHKVFEVAELTDSTITLILNSRGKRVSLTVGESYVYRPMSMDGGHYYTITIQ